ncbi:MAG: LysR family transcriptional regulator [Oscillospiraceae bacterium]
MFRSMDYIYEVYKERSFTSAAKNLYISQPALSAAVKKVENKVGAELFDRNSSPIALTDAGRAYIDATERIYAIQKDFLRELSDLENSRVGNLTVSAATLISSLILPRIIMHFSSQYPGVHIEMTEGPSAELHEKLLGGEIELLLDYMFDSRDYTAYPLLEESILLAVPASFSVNRGLESLQLSAEDIRAGKHLSPDCPAVELRRFENEPFLLLKKGNDMYDRSLVLCSTMRCMPKHVYQLDQLMTCYHAAKAGMGVTFITDTLPKTNNVTGNVVFYRLAAEHTKRTLYLAHKRGGYISHAAQAFIRSAQDFCENHLFQEIS